MNNIKESWNKQPFLERLLFLMNEFDMSQNEAEPLAKLEFNELNEKLNNILN